MWRRLSARAYETEDSRALGRLLTRDVQRVLPAGVARGRAGVVTEYERQFQANETESYELDDLEARGGRAGRASARYRVTRAARRSRAGSCSASCATVVEAAHRAHRGDASRMSR